jgi:16S rRNA (adenine1518-N6/adenine1519-N6)-dimethyltransferase
VKKRSTAERVSASRASQSALPPARKSLGQHFLVDPNIVRKIIRLAELQPGEMVLEIGAGRGVLTEALLGVSGSVVAIEVDPALCAHVRAVLGHYSNLKLIEEDALDFDFGLLTGPFVVVANLPYYLSTPLLFRLIREGQRISRMVLMLQEEVVTRLAAPPGRKEYGVLSIAAQFRCEVRQAFRVSPSCFHPQPRVGSAVAFLTPLSRPRVMVRDEAVFFKFVRAGFAHRRKALLNSLRDEGFETTRTRTAMAEAGIDPGRRAETLAIEEFADLANAYNDGESTRPP